MSTPGLTSDSTVEVITAYSATNQTVPAVTTAPGWFAIGAFFLPVTTAARLEMIGAVSNGALVMTARLFDLEVATAVSGSNVQIASTTDDREISGVFNVVGGRTYQIQVQVVGGVGADLYGALKTAGLVN